MQREEDKERKIGDLVGSVKKDDFTYQVIKQLKIKFKVGTYTVKNGSETYRSKTLTFDEFLDLHSSDEKYFDEELVFNKLALLAFST